jgi:hypothetical protein
MGGRKVMMDRSHLVTLAVAGNAGSVSPWPKIEEVLAEKYRATLRSWFVMDLDAETAERAAVHIAGITRHPDNSWMTQVARDITDVNDGLPSQH